MHSEKVEGIVVKNYGGFYYIQDQTENIYECKLRGKVKGQVLVGDRVKATILQNNTGILEEILPRVNVLYRPKIANVTKVIIVMANDKPAPSLMLLDKLLLLTHYFGISPLILLNKCDLSADKNAVELKQYYPAAGFDFIMVSAKTKMGIDLLAKAIKDHIAVFAGPSGSGKSSLLNVLADGLQIKTQEVSTKIGRGKHTTRHVELYWLKTGGWIADTPGFSLIDIPPVNSHELADFYPDFKTPALNCRFNNCLHHNEKDCGVKKFVEDGIIKQFRYENYISLLKEVQERERCYK